MVKTKIDGQYIEDLISGFRTLGVDGREELDLDVTSAETETSDGGRFVRRKINSRVLRVHFHLSDATASGFSTKLKALQAKLYSVKESKIIFSDASNYYFTGSFRKLTLAYKGMTVTRGTFEIFCADPFKYSTTETTVTAVNGTITTTYNGTYPAHPKLTAQSAEHDCGFYGFTKDGLTIRVGNPDEQDQEEVPTDTAVTIISTHFGRLYDGMTGWRDNAVLLYGYDTNFSTSPADDYIYATLSAPPAITYYYGAAGGHNFEDPYPNFELSFSNWFEPTTAAQGGGFDFYVNNSGSGNVCGVSVWKNKNGRVQWSMIVKGNVVKSGSYSLTDNPFKGAWRTQTITKTQGTVAFNFGGVSFTVTDPDLAGHAYDAANASFIFYRQPDADGIEANNALQTVLIRGIPNSWQEVANKIPQNGLVSIDTKSGNITLNGARSLGLGVITNNFEDFVLEPGSNTITCEASDWVDDAEYTLKYREAYL
jgi:predicted phage tail component-like protein